jgi:gamma-glutamylaminecyclotransferase
LRTKAAAATDRGAGLYAGMHRVFVFGTLKQGFPLHRQGLGDTPKRRDCRTVERFPMFIAGPWYAPMMMNEPGYGLQVRGELYEVDDTRLVLLDGLESVGKPGNFRVVIEVEALDSSARCLAFAYVKSRVFATPIHSDLVEVYDDDRFVSFDRRG